jgi:uncharacterized membrane protein
MVTRMESAVTIARPVEDVFGFFRDFEKNASTMDPSVESVAKAPEGPTRPGTTFRFRQKLLGTMRDTTTTFAALEPNRRIEIEARLGPLSPKGAITFDQTDRGTMVVVRVNPNPAGPLKLLAPVLARVIAKVWDDRLGRIKAALESSPRAAGAFKD